MNSDDFQKFLTAVAVSIWDFEQKYHMDPILEDAIELTRDEDEPTGMGFICDRYLEVAQHHVFERMFQEIMGSEFPGGMTNETNNG